MVLECFETDMVLRSNRQDTPDRTIHSEELIVAAPQSQESQVDPAEISIRTSDGRGYEPRLAHPSLPRPATPQAPFGNTDTGPLSPQPSSITKLNAAETFRCEVPGCSAGPFQTHYLLKWVLYSYDSVELLSATDDDSSHAKSIPKIDRTSVLYRVAPGQREGRASDERISVFSIKSFISRRDTFALFAREGNASTTAPII